MPAVSVIALPWSPPWTGAAAGAVLLVDGLLGDAQPAGDVLPGPALGPGVVDLQGLQGLDQAAQGGHRPQPQLGVAAAGGRQGRHLGAELRSSGAWVSPS